jgi:hypothetical protein
VRLDDLGHTALRRGLADPGAHVVDEPPWFEGRLVVRRCVRRGENVTVP